MDHLVGKLEDFGLEKLIDSHRLDLCENTLNPEKMAKFLIFDPAQLEIIMDSANDFAKCSKMYELIEKVTTPSNFVQALEHTNNGHVVKFVEAVLMGSSSCGQNPSTNPGLWFNIPEPIDSFCGREDFLTQLRDKLKPLNDSSTEVTILSQVKLVSGLGGIGKTETAKRYMRKYRKFYNNFIWIDAETENSMSNSFLKLAKELKIPVKNSKGKSRKIKKIVKDIYNNICDGGKSNLIVFDNAEDYKSCKSFFPFGLHPELKQPVILATSRNQEWISPTGKIQVLPLDVLTDDESLEFILKELEIPETEITEFREESKEFIQLIGGLPLALQQAVAFIRQEKEQRELAGIPYKMSNYVQEFKSIMKKFPSCSPESTADLSPTVFVTLFVTFQRLQSLENGESAVKILNILSFLYSDKIPLAFLRHIVPGLKDDEFSGALNLLEKYSLIKMSYINLSLSIHRALQFVLLQYLKEGEQDEFSKVVTSLLVNCKFILRKVKLSEYNDIFLSFHQIVEKPFFWIPQTEKFLDFLSEFGYVLSKRSRHLESLDLYKKVYMGRCGLFGESHQKTIRAEIHLALQLEYLRRDKESLHMYKEILKKQQIHPNWGLDHPETVHTKHKIANMLRYQKKYKKSLSLFLQVLVQRQKICGKNHPETLTTQRQMALLHLEMGNLTTSLFLFEQLEKKQVEILGPDHNNVLQTKHHRATVLLKMDKFEGATKILKEVYEKRKETLGENHLDTITTLKYIADTLVQEGKLEEALEMYNKVYTIRQMELGQGHPDTINVHRMIVHYTH